MAPPPFKVATVCTGNICRSPMAEVLLRNLVDTDPLLTGRVEVTSAGTARWHVGRPMDPRARRALDRAGLTGPGTVGVFADRNYLSQQDLIVVMTREHREEVQQRMGRDLVEVILWRDLSEPNGDLDVADPYYGDDRDFDDCLHALARGGPKLVDLLRAKSSGG